jgi:predicted MPP superfamily phosphohydrolase
MMRWQWRRRALQWAAWLSALAVVAFCVQGFVREPAQLVQRDHVLSGLPGWTPACDGLRVDVLADIHTGSPRNGLDKLDRIVREVAGGDADLVLLAGDYLILSVFLGEYVPPEAVADRLRALAQAKPVFGVLGNHDWWKGGADVKRAFESAGIPMIDNRSLAIEVDGCRLWLAGIGDLWEGRPDIRAAFAGIAADGAPVLALTHHPDVFARVPARASLLVAGHTHGGQVSFAPLVDPRVGTPWVNGHYVDDGRHLFVSPGLGTSIVPLRFRVPPEVSRLTLRR